MQDALRDLTLLLAPVAAIVTDSLNVAVSRAVSQEPDLPENKTHFEARQDQ